MVSLHDVITLRNNL